MCRASTEPGGGYRCIKREELLKIIGSIYDGNPHPPKNSFSDSLEVSFNCGAFWLDHAPVPSLSDLIKEVANTRNALADKSLTSSTKELFISHLGNMISVYSDNQVLDFNNRLQEINQSFVDLEESRIHGEISPEEYQILKEIHKKQSISLSFEVRENLLSTLSSLRDFGEVLSIKAKGRYLPVSETLKDVSTFFPSQWNSIRGKNEFKFIEDPNNSSIAYFSSGWMAMYVPKTMNKEIFEDTTKPGIHGSQNDKSYWQNRRVLMHETSHYYETVSPQLRNLEKAFREKRVKAAQIKEDGSYIESPSVPVPGQNPTQKFHIDHFVNIYVGADYKNPGSKFENFEIFSMGMESIFASQQGSLIGLNGIRPDPDHRNFIVGVLASLDLPKKSLMDPFRTLS